jgi:Lar family restriction alleviation protein
MVGVEHKLCPFCGGHAIMQEPHWRDGNLRGEEPFCQKCGVKMPRYWPMREAEAIAAWNQRAPDPETARLRQLVEKMGEALEHVTDCLVRELGQTFDDDLDESDLIGMLGEDYGRHVIAARIRIGQALAIRALGDAA